MKITTQPYEILIRFRNGILSGAHFQTIDIVTDDSGNIMSQSPGFAQPLDMASQIAKELLGQAVLGTVAAVDAAKAESAKELADSNAARDSVAAELATLRALSTSLLDQARKIDHPDVQAIVAEADKPEKERRDAAIDVQIAELLKQKSA